MTIKINNVSKSFGKLKALSNINLEFGDNKIYGLLGRNGAGKSTLLNIISGRIMNYDGSITIDGENLNCDKSLGNMYIMSDKMLYPEDMKVKDALDWTKEFYSSFDYKYAMELCDKFELSIKNKVSKLSTGYTSIFKLVIALAVNTPYVFYDEPVLGLDANYRELFYKELIANYSDKPKTIIVSTHLIEEAAGLLEHVVMIRKGSIIADEDTENLVSKGYTVTGNAINVDGYVSGKKVLGTENLGKYKTAYVFGDLDESAVPDGLDIGKLDLQKLFIEMTNN